MFCNICSKKYDETGHVCAVELKAKVPQDFKPGAKVIITVYGQCHFCSKLAHAEVGKLRACKDHEEDALAYRDNQQERGE